MYMLEFLAGFVTTIVAVGVAGVGYVQSRRFVSKRLRFVDKAQNPVLPVVAGVGAVVLATPVVILLPFVVPFTAVLFGLAVGFGTRAGVRSFDRALMP
jgi:hypothetical protein